MAQKSQIPYPPSWIDQLIALIERLPGRPWLFYVAFMVFTILLGQGLHWLDGTEKVGVFRLERVVEAPLTIYFLALMHYLNMTAKHAMDIFRPAIALEDAEVDRFRYELTTLPRSVGVIAAVIGLLAGLSDVLGSPDRTRWGIQPGSSLAVNVFVIVNSTIPIIFTAAFVFHTIYQLRLVDRLHKRAQINLLNRMPVYAFSYLTARTGIGIILIVYYYIFTFYVLHLFGSEYIASSIEIALMVMVLSIAIASFISPLNGMHHRLEMEKSRLMAEADHRFEAALNQLHKRLDSGSLQEIEPLNTALSSLVIERDTLEKISTWPWRQETLRLFLTTLAFPLLIWLITSMLNKFLGM